MPLSSSTASFKPPSSKMSSTFLAGEISFLPPPTRPPDLNLGGTIPPVPPVPPEPPPQLSALLLSSETALRLFLIPCLPPPLVFPTFSALRFLQVSLVPGPVESIVSFVSPPSSLLQVINLILFTPLGLVTVFCSLVVEVCGFLNKEIYGLSKNYDTNCGLFLLYLSDHILGDAELLHLEDVATDLPHFEDVYSLPQCEDATDLPQYEVVIELPSFRVVLADLLCFCRSIVEARPWTEAQALISSHAPSSRPLLQSITPLPNRVSGFTNTTWQISTLCWDLGWCFKDFSGVILQQGSSSHRYVSSALMAEALAIQASLFAAFVLEIPDITVLLVSLPLISLLISKDELNELKSLLHDIRIFVALFSSISFLPFKRTANVVADSLYLLDVNSTSF